MTAFGPPKKALSAASILPLASSLVLAFALVGPNLPVGAQGDTRGPGVRVSQSSEATLTTQAGEVVLKCDSRAIAGRPQFKYLPGSNGDTVLTADFEGLNWNHPTKIIRLNSSEKGLNNSSSAFRGIKEIRIGQFQTSPSILRVSFIARDPLALKKVAIGAAPGVLKLSWTALTVQPTSQIASQSAMPPRAPQIATAPKTAAMGRADRNVDESGKAEKAERAEKADKADKAEAAPRGWLSKLKQKTKGYFSSTDDGDEAAKDSNKDSRDIAKDSVEVAPAKARVATASSATPRVAPPLRSAQAAPKVAASRAASADIVSMFSNPGTSTAGDTVTTTSTTSTTKTTSTTGPATAPGVVASTTSSTTTTTASSAAGNTTTSTTTTSDEYADKPGVELVAAPPPLITLETADAQGSGAKLEIFRVERPDGKPLNFKSFRLHNPERYVVDMPDCRELADAILPEISQSPLVSSVRVGLPGDAEGAGRLVLQLTDDTVSIEEFFNNNSSYMTVTLAKTNGANAGIARTGSGGPILVPRAPSETVIVLDAGHGGNDPGAVRGDVQEKEVTMAITAKLKKVLEGKGARIVMTRSDDTFVSLEDRAKITNTVMPNLFLSVHINSLESTSNIYGIETYFQTDQSRPLANRVHQSLVSGLSAPDRNVRKARFYVINHTPVPAILAEVGYITNKAERDRLISSDYQQKVASALARGVMLYLQDVKSQSDFANNANSAVSSTSAVGKSSKVATGNWKPTK
jgi:N-acetylmuramoyl-L-alanine amidase